MESEDAKILTVSETPHESKETRKKQEKDRKKGEKKMDQFIKSIANCTPDEKIEALCKKNTESLDQNRTLKSTIQLLQRKIIALEKEKEQFQNEQSKSVLARSRLETLCRELQRQNKSIKEESMQKIREEEEKRKEVSTRFQTALNEVSVMMQQNTDKNLKLRDDNIEISNKFQKLCDQFKQREEEVLRLTKQMDLEKQLAEATVKRIECQLNAERGMWNKEKEHYAAQLKFHEEEKVKFENNIKNLEDHLSLYSNKYSDFESTIAKSNEVFDNYKVELNRMSKQIQKLEQENNILKEKWVQSQHAFTNVTLEHRICDQSLQERDKKLKQLADLCRSIQEERSAYLKQLKENGLTPIVVEKPPTPIVEPEKPKNNVSHKITKKEKQLSLLKKEMQVIEKQLSDTLKSSQNETNGKQSKDLCQEIKKDENEKSATDSAVNQLNINVTESTPSHPEFQEAVKIEINNSESELGDNSNQKQSVESIDITQEAAESDPVRTADQNQTSTPENKDPFEKLVATEENDNVPNLLNNTETKSETKINDQEALAKDENKDIAVENAKSVCVHTENTLDVNQKEVEKESSQSMNNTDSNKNKNKSKGQKSKKNKK